MNAGGNRISVAQVVNSATVVSERELARQRDAAPAKVDDQKLVKGLLVAAMATTIVLAAIVGYVVTRPLRSSGDEAHSINAGSTRLTTVPTATKWVDMSQKTDAQLQPGVKVRTPQQLPVVPGVPGPIASEPPPPRPLDMRNASDAPAPHQPVIDLSASTQNAKDTVSR
jgi:hypothetical protein